MKKGAQTTRRCHRTKIATAATPATTRIRHDQPAALSSQAGTFVPAGVPDASTAPKLPAWSAVTDSGVYSSRCVCRLIGLRMQ